MQTNVINITPTAPMIKIIHDLHNSFKQNALLCHNASFFFLLKKVTDKIGSQTKLKVSYYPIGYLIFITKIYWWTKHPLLLSKHISFFPSEMRFKSSDLL